MIIAHASSPIEVGQELRKVLRTMKPNTPLAHRFKASLLDLDHRIANLSPLKILGRPYLLSYVCSNVKQSAVLRQVAVGSIVELPWH